MERNSDMCKRLDESLLIEIVGRLPFQEAARTSILSKQWRNLWKETKDIEFNEKFFVEENVDDETKHGQRVRFFSFMLRFIDNFPEKVGIERFAFKVFKPELFSLPTARIVNFPFRHNVKHLELDFSNGDDRENQSGVRLILPSYVYELTTLESLKLSFCGVEVTELTKFTMLKELSLGWIEISMYRIDKLLNNCSLLESLCLTKCWGFEYFNILNNDLKIKRLVLDGCFMGVDYVSISGPKLEFFKYKGGAGVLHLQNQSTLKVVEIDCGEQDEFVEVGDHLCDLLYYLYAVEDLTVSSTFLQMVTTGDDATGLEMSLSVKNLTFKTAVDCSELLGIRFMLKSCEELETLTILIGPEKILPAEDYLPEVAEIHELYTNPLFMNVNCLEASLKVVDVKGFTGADNEFRVLKFLINFGRVLQQVNVDVAEEGGGHLVDRELTMTRAKMLHRYEKASLNLQISIF